MKSKWSVPGYGFSWSKVIMSVTRIQSENSPPFNKQKSFCRCGCVALKVIPGSRFKGVWNMHRLDLWRCREGAAVLPFHREDRRWKFIHMDVFIALKLRVTWRLVWLFLLNNLTAGPCVCSFQMNDRAAFFHTGILLRWLTVVNIWALLHVYRRCKNKGWHEQKHDWHKDR